MILCKYSQQSDLRCYGVIRTWPKSRGVCVECVAQVANVKIVTPKGVLRLALCHASATREGS